MKGEAQSIHVNRTISNSFKFVVTTPEMKGQDSVSRRHASVILNLHDSTGKRHASVFCIFCE